MPSAIKGTTIRQARHLRKNMTEGEKRLWKVLKCWKRDFGLHVRRQAPVGKYIADFLINERNLVIEVDGADHSTPGGIAHDKIRDEWLNSQGYRVARYSADSIDEMFEGCIEEMMREAGIL